MKAEEFDRRFDAGEDVTKHLDLAGAGRPGQNVKRVNVDFPVWMIASLDKEARRLGVPRQSIIKVWLAERLERAGYLSP
ncbi:MAG: hypothetical protein OXO48_10250 [Caldilineaceae bacterium]|nr:hypothetical protein [Caldilineaceae bacterium]MDE0450119.1 hypothetical protein [Spirochaetaceae bacterium]